MKTFTTQVSPHFLGSFLPSLVSMVTQFSTTQHSFQVPSEEPGPGVCQALVVGDPIRQGLCLSRSSATGKASQRRGQLREGVQGECESGNSREEFGSRGNRRVKG